MHLDENEERSMVEPASLENIKLKELKEVTKNNDENFYLWNDVDVRTEAGCHDKWIHMTWPATILDYTTVIHKQ